MTAPVHTVRGYAGLVSVTVQSLGFVPEQSLVMVCLADSSRLGPIVRIDLPGPVGDSEAFAAAVGDLVAVADRHADAVVLVLFSTDPFQLVVSGLSGPAGAGNRRFEWPHLRLSGQVLSGLGGPT